MNFCKFTGNFLNWPLACFFFKKNLTKQVRYRAEYNGVGGRRCSDLEYLVDFANTFSHVFVIVGDNDVRERSVGYILENFLRFKEAVWPTHVKFAEHFSGCEQ